MKKLLALVLLATLLSCNQTGSNQFDTVPEQKSDSILADLSDYEGNVSWVPDSLEPDTSLQIVGDFNADGNTEWAGVVTDKNTLEKMVFVYNSSNEARTRLIRNEFFPNSEDLDWIESIELVPEGSAITPTLIDSISGDIIGPDFSRKITLPSDGIRLTSLEACGGGVLYWKDGEYHWINQE